MPPLFWFLSGAATALGGTLLVARLRRHSAPEVEAPPLVAEQPPVETELDAGLVEDTKLHLEQIASGIGTQLADLATGVEGSAQQLCESMGQPRRVARFAELLWGNVRQIRLFSEKLISFSNLTVETEPCEIPQFLSSLRHDLETFAASGLKVDLSTSGFLPRAQVAERELRYALLFLVDTMLAMESHTSRLSLRAHTDLSEVVGQETKIAIEICAYAEPSERPRAPIQPDIRLSYNAARNLLEAQGISFSIEHIEGLKVSCFLSMHPADDDRQDEDGDDEEVYELPTAEREDEPVLEPTAHAFGGVLLLENDHSIRQMLALELEQTGRNIFTCTDGASARSLIEATPERFELLILDHNSPIEAGDKLAADVLEQQPDIKVLLLSARTREHRDLVISSAGRLAELYKPFGILEFRQAISALISPVGDPERTNPPQRN